MSNKKSMMGVGEMMSNAKMQNPYVGPRTFSYEERNIFFGREREARDLLARVVSERLLLFYAQSGAGKSSLLNTRLIPQLRGEESERKFESEFAVLPIGRVGGELPADMSSVENIYLFNLMASLDQSNINPQRLAQLNLKQFLAQLSSDDGYAWHYSESDTESDTEADSDFESTSINKIDEDQEFLETEQRYLLIIDQFEEIITTQPHRRDEREAFFDQLNQVLVNDPSLWVVLTLRSDYVAALDPYAHFMYNKLRARFYMERMGVSAAVDAVKEPAALAGRPFADGVGETLVAILRRVKVFGQAEEQLDQSVEPLQLQVVCYQLWERLSAIQPTASEAITLDDLEQLSDGQGLAALIDQALSLYYEDTLQEVLDLSEHIVTERQLRDWFSTNLITASETRNLVNLDDETNTVAGLPHEAIIMLTDRYLVRAESRAGGFWYELVHDRFIQPILISNQNWLLDQNNLVITAARIWDTNGRNTDFLLRGRPLEQAQIYAAKHPEQLGDLETTFLKNCKEQGTKESARRNLYLALAMAATAIIAVFILMNTLSQERVIASLLAANSSLLKADAEIDTALLLAAEAYNLDKSDGARSTLHYATARSYEPQLILLSEHNNEVRGAAYSPDGKFIATASTDGQVLLRDAETFQVVKTLITPQENLIFYRVAINPDSTLVAAGAAGGYLVVWDIQNGRVHKEFSAHSASIYSLAFSPDGYKLATGGADSQVIVWDITTWEPTFRGQHQSGKWVWDVAFSPDGRTLASGGRDEAVRLWDLTEPATIFNSVALTQHSSVVTSIAFYPDSTTTILASADASGGIIFWDLTFWQHRRLPLPMSNRKQKHSRRAVIWDLDFNPDGNLLAAASSFSTFRYWDIDLSSGIEKVKINPFSVFLDGHTDAISSLDFSPDGEHIVVASWDHNVSIWEVNSGNLLTAQAENPDSMAFLDEEQILFVSNKEGIVSAWDVQSKASLEPRELDIVSGTVKTLLSQDASKLLVAADGGVLQLWDVDSEELLAEVNTSSTSTITALTMDQSGLQFAAGQKDGAVTLWKSQDGLKFERNQIGEQGEVHSLAFNHSRAQLASGGCERASLNLDIVLSCTGEIVLWDTNTGQSIGEPFVADSLGKITALTFSHEDELLAAGNSGGLVTVRNLDKGTIIMENPEHRPDDIRSLIFTPDDKFLISAGPYGATDDSTGTILIWDVERKVRFGRSLNEHDQSVTSLLVSQDGKSLYSAGPDNYIIVNRLNDTQYWLKRACQLANRELTALEREQYLGGRRSSGACR